MDINLLLNAVGLVGAPLVILGIVFWYVKYKEDKNEELLRYMMDKHESEMVQLRTEVQSYVEKVTTALDNNTLIINKLYERMEK